jgi:hypothetical protein
MRQASDRTLFRSHKGFVSRRALMPVFADGSLGLNFCRIPSTIPCWGFCQSHQPSELVSAGGGRQLDVRIRHHPVGPGGYFNEAAPAAADEQLCCQQRELCPTAGECDLRRKRVWSKARRFAVGGAFRQFRQGPGGTNEEARGAGGRSGG